MGHTLEEITMDAELCARHFWWKVHDDRLYPLAGTLFSKQAEIIAKYRGNKPDLQKVTSSFALTLQRYDEFTHYLKTGEGDSQTVEKNVMDSMFLVYKALGIKAEGARYNTNWWVSYARSRIAEKRKDDKAYKHYRALMIRNLVGEHKAWFGLDDGAAEEIIKPLLEAIPHHDARQWNMVEQTLAKYYQGLFATLAGKNI